MTAVAATSVSAGPGRLRIAITSPDILAHIRQVFATKNLVVEITRLPYVEITVRPTSSAAPADPSTLRGALHVHPVGARTMRRPCAEYRLNVVEACDQPKAETAHLPRPRHLTSVPDPDVADPEVVLSGRQREVMVMVSRGVRNAEIAERLHISEKTVKNHINRIFKSLGAGSRVEAVLIWQQLHR